jgi:hypothetical protein
MLKELHPNWSTKQVMKYLTKAWKGMSEEEKAKYKDYSEKDRSRFDEQRKELKGAKEKEPIACPQSPTEFQLDL